VTQPHPARVQFGIGSPKIATLARATNQGVPMNGMLNELFVDEIKAEA
jgi:hypothetical protein